MSNPEAFCHMLYRSESGREISIWNSRDGVTPFGVFIDDEDMTHVEWQKDQRNPGYEPKPGDYIFVDMTLEVALAARLKYVEHWWQHPEYPMCEHESFKGKTPQESALMLAEEDAKAGTGSPHLVKVTAEWVEGFRAGRRNERSRQAQKPALPTGHSGGRFA